MPIISQTVKFTNKNKPTDTYVLNIDIPENDEVHFCGNLMASNEKLEIVDDDLAA